MNLYTPPSSDVFEKALGVLSAGVGVDAKESGGPRKMHLSLQEAENLKFALSVFGSYVEKRIATLSKQANLQASINRLPVEVLTAIFTQVVGPFRWRNRCRKAMTISFVSSSWYGIVTSTPSLWNRLSSGNTPNETKLMLNRSKRAPLHLHFKGLIEGEERAFLKLLTFHMSRWKTLVFESFAHSTLALKRLNKATLPVLECLIFPGDMPTDYTLDVVAPALKEIYAPFSMPLSLDTICHSALTEIQFRGILWGKTCQLWHYQHLFSSAPCLERITLCGAAFQQSMAPAPIHLPNLRSLQLYQVPYSLIGVLLSSIIASPSWHPTIKIWIEAFTGLAEDIFPPSPLPSSLLSTIYCSNRLSIDAPDWNQYRLKVGIELPDRDMGLMYIKFDGGLFGLREISARLARIVCCSQLEILELNGSETFHSQISRHVVPVVPNLETLRIRSRRVENPSDFSFLRSVILDISCVDVSAFEQPICLKLRHVTLDLGQLDLGVVGQLILGRTSGHDSQIGSSKLPCKLEVVEVPDDIGLQMDPLGEEVQQIAARHGVELRYRKFST